MLGNLSEHEESAHLNSNLFRQAADSWVLMLCTWSRKSLVATAQVYEKSSIGCGSSSWGAALRYRWTTDVNSLELIWKIILVNESFTTWMRHLIYLLHEHFMSFKQ